MSAERPRPLTLLLGLTLAAAVLVVQALLAEPTRQRERRAALGDLAALAAPVTFDNDPFDAVQELRTRPPTPGLNATLVQAMPLRTGDRQVGLVVDARATGYVDQIVLRVAFAADGRVLGTRVLTQRETAGLGRRLVDSDWLRRFTNRIVDAGDQRWRLRRDGGEVDQITGATVTSRAALHALLLAASVELPASAP
ncbi:MAG: FMN-binding protein [Pseudomonadota bacterium]